MKSAATRPVVVVVADDDATARAVASRIGAMAEVVARAARPGDPGTDGAAARAAVVVLAFASLDSNGLHARALRDAAAAPPVLVLRCRPAETEAAARCVENGLIDDYVADDGIDSHRLPTTVFAALRLAAALRPARTRPLVFVVEDDAFSHELVAAVLAADGVDLVFETDGEAALERIRTLRPDLVLMDVMLPGYDGVELTQRMKADAALASIPIVMVTGEARRETLVRSMEAGAADFVVKPFTPDALRGKLAKYLPAFA